MIMDIQLERIDTKFLQLEQIVSKTCQESEIGQVKVCSWSIYIYIYQFFAYNDFDVYMIRLTKIDFML